MNPRKIVCWKRVETSANLTVEYRTSREMAGIAKVVVGLEGVCHEPTGDAPCNPNPQYRYE